VLNLTVLGSGTIIPSSWRQATSLLVETGEESILLDCGPCAIQTLENSGRSFRDIHRIFLTHFHPDHTLGVGRLLSAIKNDSETGDRWLVIYGPDGLDAFINSWNLVYRGIVPGDETLNLVTMQPGYEIDIGDTIVTAGPADHMGRPAVSYRIEQDGSDIVYTGDTGWSHELVRFAKGARLLICECSFPDGSEAPDHLTPSAVARLANLAEVGEVLLVHMYPGFEDWDPAVEIGRNFNGTVTAARDGMALEI
jgi:ribonuclease BN (tRNA processing enzyme)